MESHFLGGVSDAGDIAYIRQAGHAPVAGFDVEHFHTAAVCADEDMVAVEGQILLRIARR